MCALPLLYSSFRTYSFVHYFSLCYPVFCLATYRSVRLWTPFYHASSSTPPSHFPLLLHFTLTDSFIRIPSLRRDHMRRVLNLPNFIAIEYKKHEDSLADKSSYRNPSVVWRAPATTGRTQGQQGVFCVLTDAWTFSLFEWLVDWLIDWFGDHAHAHAHTDHRSMCTYIETY